MFSRKNNHLRRMPSCICMLFISQSITYVTTKFHKIVAKSVSLTKIGKNWFQKVDLQKDLSSRENIKKEVWVTKLSTEIVLC